MQNITYGWRNINRRFYFIPKIDGGIIKDYNWDSYNVNDFVRGTDQIPVNEATATPLLLVMLLKIHSIISPEVRWSTKPPF